VRVLNPPKSKHLRAIRIGARSRGDFGGKERKIMGKASEGFRLASRKASYIRIDMQAKD